MFTWIAPWLQKLRESLHGTVAIQMGLIFVALIGMGALSVDIGFAYYKHRQMQSAADAAAFGAAIAESNNENFNAINLEAFALAAQAGFVNGVNGVRVTPHIPPVSPPASAADAANPAAVQVIITQPQTLHLAGVLYSGAFTLSAQAVAAAGSSGSYCMLALDQTACGAVTIENNAIVQPLPCDDHCGVAANSSCGSAIVLKNNAQINGPVSTVGNWSLSNNAKLNCTPKKSGASRVNDPYKNVSLPASPLPSCPSPSPLSCPLVCTSLLPCTSLSGTVNLTPGRYKGGWNYSNNVTLNLAPGVYYIDNQLSLQNNVTVNATGGVTLVLNGNYPMNLGNNTIINITAPANGPTAGLAIASIRTNTQTQTFSNNVTLNMKGALYFPNGQAYFSNNAIIKSTTCTQLIAGTIDYQNNATLDDSQCKAVGGSPIGGGATTLVE